VTDVPTSIEGSSEPASVDGGRSEDSTSPPGRPEDRDAPAVLSLHKDDPRDARPFSRVLVANRGEIALRIIR